MDHDSAVQAQDEAWGTLRRILGEHPGLAGALDLGEVVALNRHPRDPQRPLEGYRTDWDAVLRHVRSKIDEASADG